MVSDKLYPNPLIGSQYCMLSQTYKSCSGVERSSQWGPSPPGPRVRFSLLEDTFREVLGCESSHVKSSAYYMISIREVFPRSVWSISHLHEKKPTTKERLGQTVTCELIKSQRLLSGWMAFPLWHERGSLEAPSRRWPWRLGKCTPSDQTGLFSGVRAALEPAAIEKRRLACGSVLQWASLAFLKKAFSVPVSGLSCREACASVFTAYLCFIVPTYILKGTTSER